MVGCGHIISKDQRYIVLLAGTAVINYVDEDMDAIYIFDLVKLTILQSEIKVPFKGKCRAILMNDKHKNNLLVTGFAKESMGLEIPIAIFGMIAIWHSIEYIYVIKAPTIQNGNNENASHWKILIDKIILNSS